jgi:DNA-binding NtrC family response regulator
LGQGFPGDEPFDRDSHRFFAVLSPGVSSLETSLSDSPTLLLVEDENLIAITLSDELTSAGFEVVTAPDGETALRELQADAARFRALVTDVRLGAGPDGWAVAHAARELYPTIAVVYMSGDSAVGWAANGVPESVMLPKPFAAAQLVSAISTLITAADAVRLRAT